MNNEQQSAKFLRQRKFMVMLPVLVIPFLTLFFWAMGGGKVDQALAQQNKATGFNTSLPDAHLKEEEADKMSFYDKAQTDSLRILEQMRTDPNFSTHPENTPSVINDPGTINLDQLSGYPNSQSRYGDPNEMKVFQKLSQLNSALDQNSTAGSSKNNSQDFGGSKGSLVSSPDVDRLERMMQTMGQPSGDDPEMKELNVVLEKILDIQNPSRQQEKLKQASEKKRGQVFGVSPVPKQAIVTSLDRSEGMKDKKGAPNLKDDRNGFFSLDEKFDTGNTSNAVLAVVHETQTLTNGSTVKLRLVNDIYINGTLIPHDQFIYGTAVLNGERLEIKIGSIRYGNSLFPVDLSVFDMDGVTGIYVPGAISREVSKNSADQGIQNLGLTTLDPSLGMQAASVGIEAAKTFLGKKVKLIRVTVKANYQVLLRDEKQKQQE